MRECRYGIVGIAANVSASKRSKRPAANGVMRNCEIALACVLLTTAACQPKNDSLPAGIDILIDPSIRYQTILGWESHTQSGEADFPTFPLYRDRLLELAVDSIGITRVRLEAWSGMENVRSYWLDYQAGVMDYDTWRCHRFATTNDNDDPHTIEWSGFHFDQMDTTMVRVVVPLKERLEASGQQLYVNVTYDSFILQCPGPYHHDTAAEYAEFALAVFLHLRSTYGLVPDAWEMILEPDNSNWRGRAIGEAMVATGELLERHGFTPDFIAPSATNMSTGVQYFDDMMQVPGVERYMKEFSYHRYGGVSRRTLSRVVERAERYGLRTSMLEYTTADHTTLHEDLKFGNVSAWQQFALAWSGSGERGGAYLLVSPRDSVDPGVTIAPRSWFLRQYFLFIRPGAQRIETRARRPSIDPVAFVNADGGHVVVILATGPESFSIGGLPAGQYGLQYTTDRERAVELEDVELWGGARLTTSIPAAGVMTVHAR